MPDNINGLSGAEVEQRIKNGQINGTGNTAVKSVKQILASNLFTFFNLLNLCLAVAVFSVGSPKNALFLGVVICNTAIGTIQKIRAKRVIDKLSLINAPHAYVIRDGKETEIAVSDIVLDDVMRLASGMQICADAEVISGECEVNESLVTGESDPLFKCADSAGNLDNNENKQNKLLSGSFVVSGEVYVRVTGVGAGSFANRITSGVRYIKKPNSEMMRSLDKIIKTITACIIPVAAILFYKSIQVTGEPMENAVTSVVAAIIGMIPEGLVLLVSMVLAVGGIRLSRHNTLVQDAYCIETLARTDVLCLDKTGTITEGRMQTEEVILLTNELNENEIFRILGTITKVLRDDNPTANAIRDKYSKYYNDRKVLKTYPFSSAKKWSGVRFEAVSYIMGAAEIILSDRRDILDKIKEEYGHYSESGKRVVLLAGSDNDFTVEKQLPPKTEPLALIIISDTIRKEAEATLGFFKQQNVDIKIISGDNPETVKSIAKKAGVSNAENCVDMSAVSDSDIANAAVKYSVFGRVSPTQKLALVKALKANGHVVGMTGDGVNDVLALKEADCSIAMQSGSQAARNVSGLVLMDSNFSSLPKVVAEGRRCINNIERSATLFLTKTTYSFFLAVIFLFVSKPYPFIPIQLTLVSALFIGIPSFILALEKNTSLVRGGFIKNVLAKSFPLGLCSVVNIALITIIGHINKINPEEIRALSTFVLGFASFVSLCYVCLPLNKKRAAMIVMLAVLFAVAILFLEGFFAITEFSPDMIIASGMLSVLSLIMIPAFSKIAKKIVKKK